MVRLPWKRGSCTAEWLFLHVPPADWPDVQKTRVAVIKAYNEAPQAQKAGILKDVVIILLHSVTPPDRVGYAHSAGPALGASAELSCAMTE